MTRNKWPTSGFHSRVQGLPPSPHTSLPQSQPAGRNAVIPSGLTVLGFSKAPFTLHSLPCSLNLAGSGET